MKKNLIALVLISLFAAPAMAFDKQELADKAKPTEEQKAEKKAAMQAKGNLGEARLKDKKDMKEMMSKKDKKENYGRLQAAEKKSKKKLEKAEKKLTKASEKK